MDLGTKILLVKRAAKASVKIVDLLHKNIVDLFSWLKILGLSGVANVENRICYSLYCSIDLCTCFSFGLERVVQPDWDL